VTDILPSGRVMYGKPPELDCSGASANLKAQCLQIAAASFTVSALEFHKGPYASLRS
jgi:hypothetical protein